MKESMNQTSPVTEQTSLKDRVFSTIEDQHVEPRPCYVFWCQNSAMWLIWLFTVLLGALATAVLLFTSTYRYYDIYEAMHDNFVTFFLQALPLLWVLAFIVLMLVAMQGLRATRRGYRLSPALVGGSSVGVSVVLGVLASYFGFGFVVDRALGEYAPMYHSAADRELKMWQQPAEGRLVGNAIADEVADGSSIRFVDSVGIVWPVHISELPPRDVQLLRSEQRVRLLGEVSGETSVRFVACGVFPWMLDKKRPMRELSTERQAYIDAIYAHLDSTSGRSANTDQTTVSNEQDINDKSPNAKICAEIAAVRRISEQMQ